MGRGSRQMVKLVEEGDRRQETGDRRQEENYLGLESQVILNTV